MPLYQLRRISTGEVFEEFMSYDEKKKVELDPDIEWVVGAPAIVSGVNNKPDSGFREKLQQIKKANIGSTVETF